MASVGTASVQIVPDLKTLNTGLASYFGGTTFSKYGKVAGAGLAAGFAAAGVGKILFDVGKEFDDAYDQIRTQTGATGKEFKKFQGVFKSVIGSVPTDFETAADAVGMLGQRLDLAAKPLQRLSKQIVALSEVTGTDVQENVEATSRLFGDWSVSTRHQSTTLDELFRLTHDTGIEFSVLTRLMVQFGAPLRQFGFNIDEAAVMFAKFEREGVNIQTLLPGMRMALKNLSLPSEELAAKMEDLGIAMNDPEQAFRDILELFLGGDLSEADAKFVASSVFGGRAWADMKAAIEEGRFEFEDLLHEMRRGDATIRGTERRTRDFSEEWLLFKNRLKTVVEPAAVEVFDSISQGMQDLNRLIKERGFGGALQELGSRLAKAVGDLAPEFFKAGEKLAGQMLAGLIQSFREADLAGKLTLALGGVAGARTLGTTLGRRFGKPMMAAFFATAITAGLSDRTVRETMWIGGQQLGEWLVNGLIFIVNKGLDEIGEGLDILPDWVPVVGEGPPSIPDIPKVDFGIPEVLPSAVPGARHELEQQAREAHKLSISRREDLIKDIKKLQEASDVSDKWADSTVKDLRRLNDSSRANTHDIIQDITGFDQSYGRSASKHREKSEGMKDVARSLADVISRTIDNAADAHGEGMRTINENTNKGLRALGVKPISFDVVRQSRGPTPTGPCAGPVLSGASSPAVPRSATRSRCSPREARPCSTATRPRRSAAGDSSTGPTSAGRDSRAAG